jgi:hypothetical protein
VLAVGYALGFRGLALMAWAAIVAVASVFGFLLAAGGLVTQEQDHPYRWARFLIPPAVLSMGALDWTLFSGMENAFHLATWGLCLWAALRQMRATDARVAMRRAWQLGAFGALAVATRPESGVCVAAFGFYIAIVGHRSKVSRGWRASLNLLVATGAPGILLLLLHGLTNLVFTGEWSANGALAKLFVNNPFMSVGDMWERYLSLIAYVVPRLTHHHFGDPKPWGLIVPVLALVPLLSKRCRPLALLLWVQIVAWVLIVALNNQVRWHNERYVMPAVAWMLVLGALGVATIVGNRTATRTWFARIWPARALVGIGIVVLYWQLQAPRLKDQIWFFGRACRNILDQHVTTGLLLKELKVKRILLGDAGALTYAADRPGLDLIGLGGYHDFPFARASVHGLGATIELIERMAVADRPDVMAIYPSWWGDLPTYFGHYRIAIPVRGNVICGGAEKVVYSANWRALDRRGSPRTLADGERIVDQVDVADLMSEKQHGYRFPQPRMGFIRYRVLADPVDPKRDLFDAGRVIPGGHSEHVTLRRPKADGRLIVRVAPDHNIETEVRVDGDVVGTISAEPKGNTWRELSLPLPSGGAVDFDLTLTAMKGESVHYHLWVVER